MPVRLSTPVLAVDPAKIHEVDTRNAESLHGMWMVFSRCADVMEEGRRLENLSWRLWNRETFCVEPLTAEIRRARRDSGEIPELSSSIESVESDGGERIEKHLRNSSGKLDLKPTILGDSVLSISRGKEKHITSLRLERMVYSIKEKKALEPLSIPTPVTVPTIDITSGSSSPTPVTGKPQSTYPGQSSDSCSTAAFDAAESDDTPVVASDTSVSSNGFVHSSSVVRGFSPSHISSSYRSHVRLSSGAVSTKSPLQLKSCPLKTKGGMFTLGGSSGDDESSFEERMAGGKPQRSSLSDGLNQAGPKKVASFNDAVESRMIKEGTDDEDAIATDDEEISESAIEDDDDSSDWEDSVTESARSSVDDKELFQRVDSRVNLVSRRSLLTMMMHQPQQPQRIGGPGVGKVADSRSTPAIQLSDATSSKRRSAESPDDDENTLTMRGPDVPRSKPIIVKSTSSHPLAHSPRTTRRNMLATELTESLRRHLLWERQQKNTAANAIFRRRHTTHDMANLQEYPGPKGTQKGQKQIQAVVIGPVPAKDKETSMNNSWNHYFDYGPWEYHVKGW